MSNKFADAHVVSPARDQDCCDLLYAQAEPRPGSASDSNWAMACHLTVLPTALFPVLNLLGPLFCMRCYGRSSEFVASHSKESLSFQLSMLLYVAVFTLIAFTWRGMHLRYFQLALPLFDNFLYLLMAFNLVNMLRGAIAAYRGKAFRYPLAIRFVA